MPRTCQRSRVLRQPRDSGISLGILSSLSRGPVAARHPIDTQSSTTFWLEELSRTAVRRPRQSGDIHANLDGYTICSLGSSQ
ncbi:hypothetical protein FGIG_00034 [Fasciola gigantica]|uniref:Uncharacterized protein n=1 Tax=Fasciola gigantica TaxID=46835 RepID=A0A504XRW8_FASGI|nr:hypothetical protein FGIG_00034 [Fasciola gigantica]